MLDGKLEKTKSQSSGGCGAFTMIRFTDSGILPGSLQVQAFSNVFPSERSEAASAVTSNCGWCSSNWINRWPTVPVAPSIPTRSFADMNKSPWFCDADSELLRLSTLSSAETIDKNYTLTG